MHNVFDSLIGGIFPFFGDFIGIILSFLGIVVSIVLHELAHGYVALWNGDATAKVNGRLSFNPLAHFDIFGFFMLMVVGFGYAKPVPVNSYNFRHRRRGMFLVAIAGITVNIILAFLSFGLMCLFIWIHSRSNIVVWQYFEIFFANMVLININLFFFNLLPIHPLDGFRVLESFTKYDNKAMSFLRKYGRYILFVLVGISIIMGILSGVVDLPIWCDPLGAYITYAYRGMRWIFAKFWGLFF